LLPRSAAMGGGASKGFQAGVKAASADELKQVVGGLDSAEKAKLVEALKADGVSNVTPVTTPSSITVYYWGPHPGTPFYGRAIGIYLTLNQAGVKYDKKPPPEMPDGSAMAVPAVDINGFCMGQTTAILVALGNMFELSGKTPQEKMQCLQALQDMNDVFGEHGKFVEDSERKKKWFTYLEKKIEGKKWLAGTSEPTIADFHGVFAFQWVIQKSIDFSEYANMTKWWADIQAHPVVAEMIASCVDGTLMIPP